MLLIYTPKISKRKRYIFDLIINNLCGYKYEITDNSEYYLNYKGSKINYSKQPLDDSELFFFAKDLLDEKGIKPHNPKPVLHENVYTIFNTGSLENILPFDPFAAAFYFVSRYEEYLPHTKDIHGRFEADQSLAFKSGFLEKPVVNHYAIMVKNLINKKFPFIEPYKYNEFSFIPTYDIDIAYAYKGKGFFRTLAGYINSIIKRDLKSINKRTRVILGKENDPFDTYSFQLKLHKEFEIKPYYFFLVGDYSINDKNHSAYNVVYQNLIKKLSDYSIAGIHPSYDSNKNSLKLKQEIWRLSSILNREIKDSRQHFLKLHLPFTYHRLMDEGIINDFTMGFASHTGFRASICSPFLFYDLTTETVTNIIVNPLIVMDGSLKDYMGLDINSSEKKVKKLIDEVYNVNGTFISLWHNESLCDCGRWEGWKELYLKIFDYAAKKAGKL